MMNQALMAWARANVANSGTVVVWAEQNAPRPALPYITLNITGSEDKEWPTIGPVDNSGNNEIINDRDFTVSIQAYGPGAYDEINSLRNSLERVTVQQTLRGGGISFISTVADVQDRTVVIGSKFEERYGFDALFRTSVTVEDNPNFVARVIGQGDLGAGRGGSIEANYDTGE